MEFYIERIKINAVYDEKKTNKLYSTFSDITLLKRVRKKLLKKRRVIIPTIKTFSNGRNDRKYCPSMETT